jgi:hypothetical protein
MSKLLWIVCGLIALSACGNSKLKLGDVNITCSKRTDLSNTATPKEIGTCDGSTAATNCSKDWGPTLAEGKTARIYYAKECDTYPPTNFYASGTITVSNSVDSSANYAFYKGSVTTWTDTTGTNLAEVELPEGETKAKICGTIDSNGNGRYDNTEPKVCGDTSVELKGNQGAALETWAE